MKALLDTHALLWWFFDDPKLPAAVRSVVANPANRVLVSSASAWEIATKHRLGKLPLAGDVVERFASLVQASRLEPLTITSAHALLAGSYSTPHRDPFDRILAAQSQLESAALITADRAFESFAIDTLW